MNFLKFYVNFSCFVFSFSMTNRDIINCIYPQLPVEYINYRRLKKHLVYSHFVAHNIPNFIEKPMDEMEIKNFIDFISTNKIEKEYYLYEITFDNKKETIPIVIMKINDFNSSYASEVENVKYIKHNIFISLIFLEKKTNFTLTFGEKEKQLIKNLISNNYLLQKLWKIYKNFNEVYEKEFIFFHKNQKVMELNNGKNEFKYMLLIHIYETIHRYLY